MWRCVFTFFIILAAFLAGRVAKPVDTLVQSQLAVDTIQPSNQAYIAQQALPSGFVRSTGYVLVGMALLVIWLPVGRRACKEPTVKNNRLAQQVLAGFFISVVILTAGCKPPKLDRFIEVGPNETAFVIPLQGDNKEAQGKFNSASYLDTKKVAAKRIQIPQVEKKIGRWDYEIEWMPAVRVIRVNRAMVSREWTPPSKGTSEKDESIPVVTKDSIQLGVGLAVTAFIEEEDAATYLYYHGEAALASVMDSNVRNWCVAELTKEYGMLDLATAQTNFTAVFTRVFRDAQAYFKQKGISIQQLGNAEGYEFKNDKIQVSINATFIAEQDIKTAVQEKIAQDTRNQKLLASATTERQAAEELFKAREAATMKNNLEIQQIQAKANLEMATKWDGKLPANILPANSPLLMNLGGKQ